MIGYSFAVFFSLLIGSYCSHSRNNNKYIIFIFCCFWWLLLSLQYDVGTDYFTYVNIFSKKEFINTYFQKKEFLFGGIIYFLNKNNLSPQIGFFITYAFLFIGLYSYLRLLKIDNISLYIYILVCCCPFLYNATNGIRQYTAIPFISVAVLLLFEEKYIKAFISFIIAFLFHYSALIVFPIIIFSVFIANKIQKKIFYLCFLLVAIFFSFKNPLIILQPLIKHSLYGFYLDMDFGKQSYVNILTKYIWLPIYIYSLKALDEENCKFIYVGIISYCIKLSLIQLFVFVRISFYFEIIALFPLYYVLNYVKKNKKKNEQIIFYLIFLLFGICLLFLRFYYAYENGIPEYSYKSIIFR